jgi:hypothetical protein
MLKSDGGSIANVVKFRKEILIEYGFGSSAKNY